MRARRAAGAWCAEAGVCPAGPGRAEHSDNAEAGGSATSLFV